MANSKRRNDQRRAEKRKRRDTNREMYKALAGTSKNIKKQRNFRLKNAGFNANKHAHTIPNCGNTGCNKCFPRYNST